jgi:hypothetical protein
MSSVRIVPALLVMLLVVPGPSRAQTPDRRGEVVTRVPEYQGERASAPIPPEMHQRNEGGSDGAGLCVISSCLANGLYQGVPGLADGKASAFWRAAKSRPGGYGPDKLVNLVRETLPGEKYASIESAGPDDLDRLSRAGYPIGGVMAWGQGYPGRISHMVSLIHYRKGGRACIVDNNFPGEFHWLPAEEYDARFRANGSWAFLFTRPPVVAVAGVSLALLAAFILFCAGTGEAAAAGVLWVEPDEVEGGDLVAPELDPYFSPAWPGK